MQPYRLISWSALDQVPSQSFRDLFSELDFGEECRLWDLEADLIHALKYVRGSKKLAIPSEWRDLIPSTIPL